MAPKIVKLPHLQATNVVDPFKLPLPTPRRIQASAPDISAMWDRPEPVVPPSLDGLLHDLWSESAPSEYTAEDTFAIEFDSYEEVERSNRFRVDQGYPPVAAPEIRIPRPVREAPVREPFVVREVTQVRAQTPKPIPPAPAKTPMERAREYVEGENEFASLLDD
jgi:hypothetical protein